MGGVNFQFSYFLIWLLKAIFTISDTINKWVLGTKENKKEGKGVEEYRREVTVLSTFRPYAIYISYV